MKGQVFIITSILVLLFILSLRSSTQSTLSSERNSFTTDFENLKEEIVNTIDTSLLDNQNVQTNLESFIGFTKEFYKGKGYQEQVEYTFDVSGSVVTVAVNITLSSESSYLTQGIIVNRTVV